MGSLGWWGAAAHRPSPRRGRGPGHPPTCPARQTALTEAPAGRPWKRTGQGAGLLWVAARCLRTWHTGHQPSPARPPSRARAPARGKRAHPAQWTRPLGTPGSRAGAPWGPSLHACTRGGEPARAGTRAALGLQTPGLHPGPAARLLESPEQADTEQDRPLGQAQLFQELQEGRSRRTRRQRDQNGRV